MNFIEPHRVVPMTKFRKEMENIFVLILYFIVNCVILKMNLSYLSCCKLLTSPAIDSRRCW